MPMNVSDLSTCYTVRALLPEDAERVLPLLRGNGIFYHYHPPEPTLASIWEDMAALPLGKTLQDKHYVGFFQGDALIAVMDLILDYPSPGTAMIGFSWWISAARGEAPARKSSPRCWKPWLRRA